MNIRAREVDHSSSEDDVPVVVQAVRTEEGSVFRMQAFQRRVLSAKQNFESVMEELFFFFNEDNDEK
jgi:hypothetical protein